jgi:uncharacterized membrane protein
VAGINASITDKKIVFRWTFLVLPLALFFICVVLTGIFYPKLPTQVAYHFQDNSPDRWLGRGALVAWAIVPQFILTLLAFITVRLAISTARYWPPENTLLRRMVPVMGNMLALPQIILALAMLDIFLYNAYQIRLIPLWISAVIVMVLGLAILGVFFFQGFRQARRQRVKMRQE